MLAQCSGWESGESSEAAERGSRIHHAIHAHLADTREAVELAPDELESASRACAWFHTNIRQQYAGMTWRFEQYVPGDLPETGGTLDAVGVTKPDEFTQEIFVLDWKSGRRQYDARTNPQGHIYALNAAKHYGINRVIVGFYNCDLDEYSHHIFNADDLVRLRHEAEARIAVAMATEKSGRGMTPFYGCGWCGKRLTCPALRKEVDHAISIPLPDVKSLSAQDLGAALDRYREPARMVAKFYEALEAHARDTIASGQSIPGWVLKDKPGKRTWKTTESAMMLSDEIELGLKEYVSPSEAERRIKMSGKDVSILKQYTSQPMNHVLTKETHES